MEKQQLSGFESSDISLLRWYRRSLPAGVLRDYLATLNAARERAAELRAKNAGFKGITPPSSSSLAFAGPGCDITASTGNAAELSAATAGASNDMQANVAATCQPNLAAVSPALHEPASAASLQISATSIPAHASQPAAMSIANAEKQPGNAPGDETQASGPASKQHFINNAAVSSEQARTGPSPTGVAATRHLELFAVPPSAAEVLQSMPAGINADQGKRPAGEKTGGRLEFAPSIQPGMSALLSHRAATTDSIPGRF